MRISTFSFLACGLALAACSLYFEQDPDDSGDGPGDVDPCTLAGPANLPGYPFDVAYYQEVVWTLTRGSCGFGGCHAPNRNGFSDFRVWADDGDACSMIQSFNDFYDHSDFMADPENSRVLRALDGSRPHPLLLGPGTVEYDVLFSYIEMAAVNFYYDSPLRYLDHYVFQQEIQPMLDATRCGALGCHHPSTALAGFALYEYPDWESEEMWQNFENMARMVDFQVPAESTILYQRATDGHGGVTASDPELLLAWIQAAYDRVGR